MRNYYRLDKKTKDYGNDCGCMIGYSSRAIMQEATALLLSLAGALMTSLADVGESLAERRGMENLGEDAVEPAVRCPRACFCNSPSHIVYCSRRGLAAIPDGVPPDTLQLNLNGNLFSWTTVTRSNVSQYPILEHLYLSECGLEYIEPGCRFRRKNVLIISPCITKR